MKQKILFLATFLFIILVFQNVLGQKIDSDGDGVLDEFDMCPDTSPDAVLPIILRNPEFLGCSCPQIYELMREEYCKDVYCHPGRPLQVQDRSFSSRINPCPLPRCEGTTLYEYTTGPIRCINGREQSYECEKIITADAEECINQELTEPVEAEELPRERDIFDLLVDDYSYEHSKFVNLLMIKSREELIENNYDVLRRVEVTRVVELNERIINNRALVVADISIYVNPKNYYFIEDFVLIEQIIGDLSNKNLVLRDEFFFDEEKQIVVWKIDELKDELVLTYRITPGEDISFEMIVQGEVKSRVLQQLLIPLAILILIVAVGVVFIINMKEKNNVFKR